MPRLTVHQRSAIADTLSKQAEATLSAATTDAYERADILGSIIAYLTGAREFHLETVPETHWGHSVAALHLAEIAERRNARQGA